jgi:hypothetical protein
MITQFEFEQNSPALPHPHEVGMDENLAPLTSDP